MSIHSETVPSPATSGTSNCKGQIYGESSQTPSTGKDFSESDLCLSEYDQFIYICNSQCIFYVVK